MGITPKFDLDKIFADVAEKVKRKVNEEGLIDAMNRTCLEVVNRAKQLDTYQDQTHYLRSSIGYIVYNKGEKAAEGFTSTGGTDGAAGVEEGKRVAAQAAKENPYDLVGVIVAGADYALYVESKGYDVLTGPFLEAAETLKKNLKLVFG